ncbi:MAG: cyclic 2,3-diphosphoglycerate synthase [Candidatus Lernaella stagnicola]|nr:cyclic 2,3-diphosphoglycerate synthase [Candidatus Lernaella stagnicola]
MAAQKVVIAGAGGRDFHNFNVFFRDNENYQVVAFTATQIPNIDDRRYPPELAGSLYGEGIPIVPEAELVDLIREHSVDQVVFSYSDVAHQTVMSLASMVNAAGASFVLLGAEQTMLKAKVPVVSVCAVRTGCGKSQTTRKVVKLLQESGKRVVAIRHPMPYGNLVKQRVQRFAEMADLDKHECTIEEREEYEPHITSGIVCYAGVDYGAILAEAEKEADVIVWDGGNNDLPFYVSDLEIVIVDPHRVGDESTYYPGLTNTLRADVAIINKIDTADPEAVVELRQTLRQLNPDAKIIEAASPIFVDDPKVIEGGRVLAIEDGPTLTHGGMSYGVAVLAAERFGAVELVDPTPFLQGDYLGIFEKYDHLANLLPAIGYGDEQIADLQATFDAMECDVVIIGTPIDLRRLIDFGDTPTVRVRYELQEIGKPDLVDVLKEKGLI